MRILLLSLPLLLTACSGGADDTAAELVGDATAGATVYSANCTGCHGADGLGDTAPALADIAAEFDDAQLAEIVVNGTDEGMPAFPQLSEQEVADVVAYLRTFAP